MEEKKCTKCGTVKPLFCFYADKSKKGGYCFSCKDCDKLRRRELYPGKNADYKAKYFAGVKHLDRFKKRVKIWRDKYYSSHKKEMLVRSILNNLLKERKTKRRSDGKYKKLIGYGHEELRAHLESLFLSGMNWGNRGEWEIDHIKPVSKFKDSACISEINSLSNIRPLWAIDNQKKGSKWQI